MSERRDEHSKFDDIIDRLQALKKERAAGDSTAPGNRKWALLVKRECAHCGGTRIRPGPLGMATPVPCSVCNGRGYNLVSEDWSQCRQCGGTGRVSCGMGIARMETMCGACGGVGWVEDLR